MESALEQKAMEFAYKAHEGQLRKDGRTPYIEHPKAVVEILKEIGVTDKDVLSAAWLHDVVEDCGVAIKTICDEFGGWIAKMVYHLTRDKGAPREDYLQRIRTTDDSDAQRIKLADVCHNCRTIEHMAPNDAERLIGECERVYLPLAKELFLKPLYEDITASIAKYRKDNPIIPR